MVRERCNSETAAGLMFVAAIMLVFGMLYITLSVGGH